VVSIVKNTHHDHQSLHSQESSQSFFASQLDDLPSTLPRKSKDLFFALCELRTQPLTTDAEEKKIDSYIAQDFFYRRAAVAQTFILTETNADAKIRRLNYIRYIVFPILSFFGGEVLEAKSTFNLLFQSTEQALRCCLTIQAEIDRRNVAMRESGQFNDMIRLGKAGLHVSQLLVVAGTDIRLGDAIFVARRLAENNQNISESLIITTDAKVDVEATESGRLLFAQFTTLKNIACVVEKEELPVFAVQSHSLSQFSAPTMESTDVKAQLSPIRTVSKTIKGTRAVMYVELNDANRCFHSFGLKTTIGIV